MRCSVCLRTLVKIGHKAKDFRDVNGRVYKRIMCPRYAPCPNKGKPEHKRTRST